MYTDDNKDYNENNNVDNYGNNEYGYGDHYDEPVLENSDNNKNTSNKSKSFIIVIILAIVLIVLIFLLIKSCDNKQQNKPNDEVIKQPVSVELSNEFLELKVSQTYKIEYTVLNSDIPLEITWVSSNDAIANVLNDGTVTALKVGTASIFASYFVDNVPYQKECIVTVIENDGVLENDNEKPILKYNLSKGKVNSWINSNVIVNVEASDNSGVVDVKYAFDCTNNCNYVSVEKSVLEINKEGTTIVTLMASDRNNNSVTETFTVKIDRTKPVCSLNVNESGMLSANYSDNGGSNINYFGFSPNYSGESVKQQKVVEGNYHFYVRDIAGNTNSCSINVLKKVQYRYQDCAKCNSCGAAGCGEWQWNQTGTTTITASCSSSPNSDTYRNCKVSSGGISGCVWSCQKWERKCMWNKTSCDACGCNSWGNFTGWSDTPVSNSASRKVETRTLYVKG